MKLKHLLLGLAISVGSLAFSQNEYVADYAQFLLEIEQNTSDKAMLKDWKKRKSAWENDLNSATSYEQLNTLMQEYTENLNPKLINLKTLPKLAITNEYYYNGQAIVSFVTVFPKEYLKSDFKVNDFTTSVKAKSADIKAIETEKAKKLEQKLVQANFADFDQVFTQIFQDSKKASFFNTAEKKIADGMYSVNNKMKASEETYIVVDEENIFSYHSFVKIGSDIELAHDVLSTMMKRMENNLPGGYALKEWIEETYTDRTRYEYEFEAEEFRISAKQPTSHIGIVQRGNDYYLRWGVTEPVFKDWSKTNKDWLKKQ
jgi:hypothetical protein